MSPMDRMDDDFRDSEISSLLARVGGDSPATNVAYQEVLGRVHRVRRRRTIATSLGAVVAIGGIGAVVIQSSSRDADRIALDPRSAVVTTPDGSMVTTPDGVVVTVITQPGDTTIAPTVPGNGSSPTGNSGSIPNGSNSSAPPASNGTGTAVPSDNSPPNGVNRPAGSTDDTTTTIPPSTTKPESPSTPAPSTTRPAPPSTRPTPPSVPGTTKPSTPSVPVVTRPSVPSVVPTTPPSSTPPVVNTITRACGAGAVKVDVKDRAFVVGSLQTVVLPGFQATVASAKDNAIEVRFTSTQGRVTATLKVRITGSGIKDDCDIEIDKKSGSNDDDADEATSDDNNGERADD